MESYFLEVRSFCLAKKVGNAASEIPGLWKDDHLIQI